jgi:FkbM family methyltransferase
MRVRLARIRKNAARALMGGSVVQMPVLLSGAINRLRQCRHGYMLYNFHDVYVGRSLDLYGEFSEREVQLFQQIVRPGDVVLDVGANIGAHTLFFAQAAGFQGQVFAFEPQRIVFQTLCANMALNSIANTYCYNVALGDHPGSVKVPAANYFMDNNFGGISLDLNPDAVGETVDMITLDSLPLSACRLIKIDVEGMEKAVLEGARATIERHKPILYVENDRPEKAKELTQLIGSLGYEMYVDYPPYYSQNNYYGNRTNVFPGTVSINLLCVHGTLSVPVTGFQRVMPGEERIFLT